MFKVCLELICIKFNALLSHVGQVINDIIINECYRSSGSISAIVILILF